ncbi:hypothetical protein Y032_0025g1286 [Ancylostoma ceylanicum]|uniref:DUF4440 domain-containing protein n=1 Tax=Ancylostoma ceylanicum TaxID=53326 RepID=A0A016UVP1_9BILA|nr:hypothetical protein Y032_0025g1286 [Ancylostoma ceylanicum]
MIHSCFINCRKFVNLIAQQINLLKPKEAKAILKPLYDALENHYYKGEMEKSMDYIHTDAVVVNKGNGAQYGKKEIMEAFKKFTEEFGVSKFIRSNEVYCGCECCLCLSCDITLDSPKKGKQSAKAFHIWKKEDGKWKLYHDEYAIAS